MTGCPFANLIDPDVYANGMPYRELKRIRDDGPVHYMQDPTRGVPYWLITGRDEIDFISKHPQLFSSEARSALADEFTEQELETIHRHMTIMVRPGLELQVLVFPARAACVWRYLGVVVSVVLPGESSSRLLRKPLFRAMAHSPSTWSAT